MEGGDFNENDSSPSELSVRRYLRYARGGASLVWFEANAVRPDARSFDRQSMITQANLDSYKRLIAEMKALNPGLIVVLQLTHSGRFCKKGHKPTPLISHPSEPLNERMYLPPDYPLLTDDYLDGLPDYFVKSAQLAREAGFDGVDVKCCHLYLYSELLSAYNRPGKYGGSFENRSRLYLDTVSAVRAALPGDTFVTSRLGMSDMIPYPWGFGMVDDGSMKYDLTETKRLIAALESRGVGLVSLTMGTPYYNPNVNRPYGGGDTPSPEPPLAGVERIINAAGEIKKAFPAMKFIGAGYSYLGEAAPYVAAGAIENGLIDAVGFGRMAFCYPDFPRDMIAGRSSAAVRV